MIYAQAPKRSAAGSSSPLLDPRVVQKVLSYVGPGHSLFVEAVSKLWKELYALETQQLIVNHEDDRSMASFAQITLYSSVFTSPSRVKHAHKSELDCTLEAYQRAAGKHADIAAFTTAHELGMQITGATMTAAAGCNNQVAVVQYLYRQGCPWPWRLLETAVSTGYLELVRWCYEHECRFVDASMASLNAAASGNVQLMAWLLQQPGTHLSGMVMHIAVEHGHTDLCRFLREQQCPWDASSPRGAARGGHIDLLHWLLDSGCPYDEYSLCTAAAAGGSMQVLMYVQQQGFMSHARLLADMLNDAAVFHHLAAAKWLREQGAEWPTAVRRCPWSGETLEWARAEGYTPLN
jgi:hypothetical protein